MTIEEWAARFNAGVTPAIAALHQVDQTCEHEWTSALLAHADQFRAVSDGLAKWAKENPCPNADLGLELTQMARSYLNTADLLEDALGSWSPWMAVRAEMRALHSVVTGVMVHYQSVIAASR